MRSTVDKAGRVVVPQTMLEAIGLAAGGAVEIVLDGAAIRIEPVAATMHGEEDGLPHTPTVELPEEWRDTFWGGPMPDHMSILRRQRDEH